MRAGFEALPAIIRGRGERASRRFIEFFTASIRNRNTRAARVLIEAWRQDYNESRPHMALGNLPPAEYATRTGTRYDTTGLNAAQN
jgi:transposase InsO family protein